MFTIQQISATSLVSNYSAPIAFSLCSLLVVSLVTPVFPSAILTLACVWSFIWIFAKIPIKVSLRLIQLPSVFLIISLLSICISLDYSKNHIHIFWRRDQETLALTTGLKSLAAISCTLAISICIPIHRLLVLGKSIHIPTFILDFIFIMYRMIYLLEESKREVSVAQINRLGNKSFRSKFFSLGILSSALFIRSQSKAIQLQNGLDARCSRGQLKVSHKKTTRTPLVYWSIAIAIPISILTLSLYWNSHAS